MESATEKWSTKRDIIVISQRGENPQVFEYLNPIGPDLGYWGRENPRGMLFFGLNHAHKTPSDEK